MNPFPCSVLWCLILHAAVIPRGAQTNYQASGHSASGEVLLLTSFKGNGQFGPTLSMSMDRVHFTPFNQSQPFFQPPRWTKGQNLVRDASVIYRDGLFHMVWTTGWTGRILGYASSRDLVHWSEV